MSECEVCGEREERYVAVIEGAKMRVCPDCAKRGKVLVTIAAPVKRGKPAAGPVRLRPGDREVEFVADYADRIKRAREKMKVEVGVIAELVREKESFLRRVETGSARPSEELAKRLEKELGIKLFEESAEYESQPLPSAKKGAGTTLGDLVFVKKKSQRDK